MISAFYMIKASVFLLKKGFKPELSAPIVNVFSFKRQLSF